MKEKLKSMVATFIFAIMGVLLIIIAVYLFSIINPPAYTWDLGTHGFTLRETSPLEKFRSYGGPIFILFIGILCLAYSALWLLRHYK